MKKFDTISFINTVKNIYLVSKNVLRQSSLKNIILTSIKCGNFNPHESYNFLRLVLEGQIPRWKEVGDNYGYHKICKFYLSRGLFGSKLKELIGGLELSKKNSRKLKGLFYEAASICGLDVDVLLTDISIDLTGWEYIMNDIMKMANGVVSIPSETTVLETPKQKVSLKSQSSVRRNSDKKKAVICTSLDGTWSHEYSSQSEAAIALKASRIGITKNINKYPKYSSIKCTVDGKTIRCTFRFKGSDVVHDQENHLCA